MLNRPASRWALLGISVATWFVALRPWGWYMGDLVVYRAGGSAFLHGRDLYAVVGGRHHLHFTYPPFAAVVIAPLAAVPLAVARGVVSILSVIALVVCLRLVQDRPAHGPRPDTWQWLPVVLAVTIWLEPVRATFSFGQINLLLMGLVIIDLVAIRDRRFSGVLIGLSAAIKLTPLAFIPFLLVTRQFRTAANAAGGFTAAGIVGFAADPHASATFWGDHLFLQAHRVGRVENASNQSVRGIIARALQTVDVPGWWIVPAAVIFVAGSCAAMYLYLARRPVWALLATAVAMLCASPVSWSHHWVWCAPMLLVCAEIVRHHRRSSYPAGAVLVMVPFVSALVFWAPHASHEELRDTVLQQLLSSTYVAAGVGFVVLMVLSTRADQVDERRTG